MNPIYKSQILLLFIQLSCTLFLSAQDIFDNEFKYWLYKERLKYFITKGDGLAEGGALIMSERNNYFADAKTSNDINFAQEPTKLAYYLGVLCTEYYLLLQSNEILDANKTKDEIERVLNAIERLDVIAEQMPPWNKDLPANGFMLRKDIPYGAWNNTEHELNKGINEMVGIDPSLTLEEASNKFYKGHPGYAYYQETEERITDYNNNNYYKHSQVVMSKDEITGLMLGYRFVYIYVPELRKKISIMTNRLISYAANANKQNGENKWVIYRPDREPVGEYTDPEETRDNWLTHANTIEFATPMLEFLTLTYNTSLYWEILLKVDKKLLDYYWKVARYTTCLPTSNTTMILAAGIASSTMTTWNISQQSDYDPNIMCNAIGGGTSGGWAHFYYALDYLFSGNSATQALSSRPLIEDDLNTAPCGGPYNFNENDFAKNGWASHFKYDKGYKAQYGASPPETGVYPGTDYMLMYNMWRIIFPFFSNPYKNRIDLVLSGNNVNPNQRAVNSITSTENINNGGNVTYTSSKSITLKPGFKVEKGATFKASLTPCFCEKDGSKILSDGKNTKGDVEYIPLSQSAKDSINKAIIKGIDTTDTVLHDKYVSEPYDEQYPSISTNSEQLIIKPNPFDRQIEIVSDFDYIGDVCIKVYDVYGNMLNNDCLSYNKNIELNFEEKVINNSGIYLLEILVDNQIYKIPVVKIN